MKREFSSVPGRALKEKKNGGQRDNTLIDVAPTFCLGVSKGECAKKTVIPTISRHFSVFCATARWKKPQREAGIFSTKTRSPVLCIFLVFSPGQTKPRARRIFFCLCSFLLARNLPWVGRTSTQVWLHLSRCGLRATTLALFDLGQTLRSAIRYNTQQFTSIIPNTGIPILIYNGLTANDTFWAADKKNVSQEKFKGFSSVAGIFSRLEDQMNKKNPASLLWLNTLGNNISCSSRVFYRVYQNWSDESLLVGTSGSPLDKALLAWILKFTTCLFRNPLSNSNMERRDSKSYQQPLNKTTAQARIIKTRHRGRKK